MQVARVRSILWLTGALGLAGAAAAWLGAAFLPVEGPAAAPPSPVRAKEASDAGPSLPPLESFEAAWQLPLRRPLVNPPPVLATTQPEKPADLMIRLTGTIVDDDRPRGVFMVGLAGYELRGVGEKAGGAEVLRIDETSATLSYGGRTFTLRCDKNSPAPGVPVGPPAARSGDATEAGM